MLVWCVLGAALIAFKFVVGWVLTGRLQRTFRQAADSSPPEKKSWPRVAILIPVRGADPRLRSGLRALRCQDYPHYELHVVVDSREDPAWPVVQEVAREESSVPVFVEELTQRFSTCGLKCSALIQAAEQLDDSIEIVAVADSDMQAHPLWLKYLVAPFDDPQVGCTYGNRWFVPRRQAWGSLVRAIWNAAALVYMFRLGIPWGGTMAIRRRALHEAGILDRWKHSMADDVSVTSALQERHLRSIFVPELMMANREDCRLSFALDFMIRQLAWVRLYHGGWQKIRRHAVITGSLYASLVLIGLTGIVTQQWGLLVFAAGASLARVGSLMLHSRRLNKGIHLLFRKQSVFLSAAERVGFFRKAVAALFTELLHLYAVCRATTRRTFCWRGVTYRVDSPRHVRLMEDRPYLLASPGRRKQLRNHSL